MSQPQGALANLYFLGHHPDDKAEWQGQFVAPVGTDFYLAQLFDAAIAALQPKVRNRAAATRPRSTRMAISIRTSPSRSSPAAPRPLASARRPRPRGRAKWSSTAGA